MNERQRPARDVRAGTGFAAVFVALVVVAGWGLAPQAQQTALDR